MNAAKELWRGSGTILLIDDEDMIRTVTSKMLEYMGFAVIAASSGEEGILLFRQRHQDLCMVLLDLSMPTMPGEQVFRKLREIHANACVVLSSGEATDAMGELVNTLGADGYISKPYEIFSLNSRLKELLDGDA